MTLGARSTRVKPTPDVHLPGLDRPRAATGRATSARRGRNPADIRPSSPPPRDNGSRPRGAARREALLEAVLRIVADVGADAVTHRRVADVAGLPLASTTYWFRSKEHLLTAAFELAAERDIDRVERVLAESRPEEDPITLAVDAIVGPLGEGVQANRGALIASYGLMLEAARRPVLREVARRWTDAYLSALGELLQRGGSKDPGADAQLLLAAADGLLIAQLASGARRDLTTPLRRLTDGLMSPP